MRSLPLLFGIVLLLTASACSDLATLRSDQPLLPVRDYERMIVGRLDADYIGNDQCLAKCHKHDTIAKNFQASIHGEQIEAGSGLPLVNCESCHGPGSLAVAHIDEQQKCNFDTLLKIKELPAQAQALICLKCHSASSTPILQYWNAGNHANSDISCFSCHKLHQGAQQKVSRHDVAELCYNCHQAVRSQFSNVSRHPVPEHKVGCTDCHNPHGTAGEHNLTGVSVREMCTRCHMEYQGPFVYEHADVTEDCTNCHNPHGAPNNNLLRVAQPFLCMQCHAGHQEKNHPVLVDAPAGSSFKPAFYSRCTDCHSAIHGTDIPSGKGKGTFIAR